MKYVMFIWYLTLNGSGMEPTDYGTSRFTIEYESREECQREIPEVEQLLKLSGVAQGYILQCRPRNFLD